ncbi:MAG TPA: MerR family transcriptional regulator [Candidatus Limnocylindria bacterium]
MDTAGKAGPMTVGAVARLAKVSVRTLHHYDRIGVLQPSERSAAGYRRYGTSDLERLQLILFYRELGFRLADIARIVREPAFDRRTALAAQRVLLVAKAQQARDMLTAIDAALAALEKGIPMDREEMFEVFGDFDPTQYEAEVQRRWGETDAYRESARRTARYGKEDWKRMAAEGAHIEPGLAALLEAGMPPDSDEAMALAEEHRLQIDRWFYPCSHRMHAGLAELYVSDDRFRQRYENAHAGLAQYVHDAIKANAARAEAAGVKE